MSTENIWEYINAIKQKTLEGYDIIPQKIIKYGCSHLRYKSYNLKNIMYYQKAIPDQGRVSKIPLIPKKVANPLWNNLQSLIVNINKLRIGTLQESPNLGSKKQKHNNCWLDHSNNYIKSFRKL